MFFSQDILTSREYGVATIWLVATLGSKSSVKKVKRKDIIDVDVPKACETIITPQAPLALRLQSSLLYGVSKVFSQQCDYVLQDAQAACNNMRQLLKITRRSELDVEVDKPVKLDQLLLRDDPTFLPELAFLGAVEDLSNLDINKDDPSQSNSFLSASGRSSLPGLGLELPSDSGFPEGGDDDFQLRSDAASRIGRLSSTALNRYSQNADTGFQPDMDLGLDTGGYLQDDIPPENRITELEDQPRQSRQGSELRAVSPSRLQNTGLADDAITNNVLANLDPMDIDAPLNRFDPSQAINRPVTQHSDILPSSTDESHENEAATQAIAAIRRRRGPRLLTLDSAQELESSVLQAWQTGYADNMREAAKKKTSGRLLSLVKTNAETWTWGSGIGGADALEKEHRLSSLLGFLRGESLLTSMTVSASSADLEPQPAQDEDVPMLDTEQPEIGRAAPTPLRDDTTLDMSNNVIPWNLRASQTSIPARAPRGSHASTPLAELGIPEAYRRRSSNVDPSSMEIFDPDEPDENDAPAVAPSATIPPPYVRTAEEMSNVFLDGVENVLDWMESEDDQRPNELDERDYAGWHRNRRSITYEVLRKPEEYTRAEAAEGLMHVLGLASRGLLAVEQGEAFGELWLTPIRKRDE